MWFFCDDRIAEAQFHAPDAEHERRARRRNRVRCAQAAPRIRSPFCLPVMMRQSETRAIEILPELFGEFGLAADRIKPGRVGLKPRS